MIDIGANLTHASFAKDLDLVLDRAQQANVTRMIVTGASLVGSEAALTLAQSHQQLSCTAGIHPHEASQHPTATIERLRGLANNPDVVAMGEAGLDYNRNYSPANEQQRAFAHQLEIAADNGLPVFLHERDAHEDFFRLIKHYRDRLSNAVVHCFTGNQEALSAYLDLDLHIGITGWICDERRGLTLKKLVKKIPANRLMLETDAPYLTPRDLNPQPKSRRNEPAFLPHILAEVARCRGESAESLAASSQRTSERFFKL